MTTKDTLRIGSLVVEHDDLAKEIGSLRAEASRRALTFERIGRLLVVAPERVAFGRQLLDSDFAGESPIERGSMDVDSLLEDLRSKILRKKKVLQQLAELGIDLEQSENEMLRRKSRELRHPATVSSGAASDRENGRIGFVNRPRQNK